jgi:NADPH:quinone reductase-like Zn-dependent oxidoreductase
MAKPRARRVRRFVALLAAISVVFVAIAGGVAYARSTNECYDETRVAPVNGFTAAVYCEYGAADVVKLETIEKPSPTDSQVLVRVRAASVNPLDWHYMHGEPYLARLDLGLRRPKNIRLGTDFAGVVESVGKSVTSVKPGDEVFGMRTGAFAQYVTVRADRLTTKPANLSFEQAAAVPVAALTALQAVRDHGKVTAGQKVLVNGASGGVGTFAVQIAKSMGAVVTGVSSTRNVQLVQSLGATHAIDYTKHDFTTDSIRYDVIIDNVGNHALSDLRKVLTPNGKYVMVGGPSGKWVDPFPRVLSMIVTSWFVDQDMTFFMSANNAPDMQLLATMLSDGRLKPVIDRTYPLRDVSQAIAYVETGRTRGKVIVVVE